LNLKKTIIAIAGPTAVGKSAVAMLLAERMQGEIIAVDSMQVYRGLDIGTAKPSAAEQARIRHHLVDVADLDEPFDSHRFCVRAREALADVTSRGRLAIFCGGTGLYFNALFQGLGCAPPADLQLRAQLEAQSAECLLHELREKDPASCKTIDTRNKRRLVRALEVIRLTGKPISTLQARWRKPGPSSDLPQIDGLPVCLFGLRRTREDLSCRIEQRVDLMFQQGLIDETRHLLSQGLNKSRTAMQALGYRQVIEYLQGKLSWEETVAKVKTMTRQYAKRQMTWFRHQLAPTWMDVGAAESAAETARRIQKLYPTR
jgi:tRNA dimethylallyltransferase